LCIGSGLDEWFEISYKGKMSGSVHLRSEWEPSGGQLAERDLNEKLPPPVVVFTNGQQAQHNSVQAQP